MTTSQKWHQRFLQMAKLVSSWSKDPSTQVGAVIVDKDNRIVSLGFNGFPKGVKDIDDRYLTRETKYELIVHAEVNAILFANRTLENCSIYVYPLPPCSRCAGLVIQSGLKHVYYPEFDKRNPSYDRWIDSFKLSKQMFDEAGVACEPVEFK